VSIRRGREMAGTLSSGYREEVAKKQQKIEIKKA
jgi:hypothetical protein